MERGGAYARVCEREGGGGEEVDRVEGARLVDLWKQVRRMHLVTLVCGEREMMQAN